MNHSPLVSIIIPFFNRNSLVLEAVKNISLQTYKNIEIILVDDGSDDCLEIVDDFGLSIHLRRMEENKGPGYARREGRYLAKGEYICYLDSDDWWSDNFIEECVKVIESNAELGMVYTNTVKIVNGVEITRRVKDYSPTTILPDLLVNTKRFWSTPSCLWRSEVSLAQHWFPLRNHEDFLHDIYSSKINNKIKFVPSALTYNNHSADNRILRDREEVRKALNEFLKIRKVSSLNGFSYFFLNRIYKNKLKIKIKDLPQVLTLPLREFKILDSNWLLFQVIVLFNIFGVKLKFQKRNIKKLKT